MLYRFGPLLLFLRSESKESHLKRSVDNHNDRNGRREPENEVRSIVDNLRDVTKADIPASKLVGVHSPEYSGVGICVHIRGCRKDMLRQEGCQDGQDGI